MRFAARRRKGEAELCDVGWIFQESSVAFLSKKKGLSIELIITKLFIEIMFF